MQEPEQDPAAAERAQEEVAMQHRIEQVRADARRARARDAERDDTVAFVRELGFDDLLED
ncbi:MAG: hypothetical protein LH468_11815 [Nocardioides sp.]|nr:hypothetical protein [Nocardioides sp.]